MKRFLSMLLILAISMSVSGCDFFATKKPTDFVKDDYMWSLTRDGVTVTLDSTDGMVKAIENATDKVEMDGILIDAGIGGEQLFRQVGYKDMSTLATYELPTLYPRMKDLPQYTVSDITATETGFTLNIRIDRYTFTYCYGISSYGLQLDVLLSTDGDKETVNGVAFLVQGLEGFVLSQATYEFPGSTPAGKISYCDATRYKATCSDYSAPAVVVTDGRKTVDILFVDEVEKWTAGSYYDKNEKPCVAFLAAAEGYLDRETPMQVGSLYIPLGATQQNAYTLISDVWTELGYHTPTDSSATEDLCAIYSGHPYGTMDTNYFNQWTLDVYAEKLDAIAQMGFDAIWLLPVFSHTGNNVYEPIDQGVIDKRYGGEEAAKVFINAAHALNMSVLFDFVPHGPRPAYSFAKEHDDWISKDINGSNQIEWECVSMDYNHPQYYQYTKDLAAYYASEFGLDGARIDCAMGGLPNWSSSTGLRASASGLKAGYSVVKALREGFQSGGTSGLLLPENFHPSPAYASVTDVFYDMPLYRTIYNLNQASVSDTEYVSALTEYLIAEHDSSVKGQLKLRFLGNHDTVTWTFDATRAQELYGTERAKAMWQAIGWIDGVLYIYQGDEDPDTYHLVGDDLQDFFAELISIKRAYLPNTLDTQYIRTESPIFAFYRYDESVTRLVLVNLSDEPQEYTMSAEADALAAIGEYTQQGKTITLQPYAGVVLNTDR